MLIVDAHQDIAWNMLTFGRDYTKSALQIRQEEQGTLYILYNDDTLLGWPEYQRGQVALIFATLFATPVRFCTGDWDRLCYTDMQQAHRLYWEQLDVYERLVSEHPDKFQSVRSLPDLEALLAVWNSPANQAEKAPAEPAGSRPVGLVLLMEGAEAVRDPGELELWWERGVRLIGPAWSSTRFCGGTREPGPLTAEGYALLERMGELGFSLDLSHMDENAALQALDVYPGQIVVSHGNALALLKGSDSNRHLGDRVIQGVLERDGMVGIVPFNAFLKAGWKRGDRREDVQIESWVSQIDYICQMAGDALHTGIGSDFDGGFGLQSVPIGIDSIADLQKLVVLLSEKGYATSDIAAILGGNWISRLRQVLPKSL
jgi:membrane dipeptidase